MASSSFHIDNSFADDALIGLLKEDNEWELKAIYDRHYLRLFHLASGVLSDELHDAIDDLPSRCKEVFRLSRFEYLSNKEISARMKISVKTVEIHITKALVVLRSRIGLFLVYLLAFVRVF